MAILNSNAQISVTNEDTFDCVIRLVKEGNKPVALDFASGTNPGGAWRTSKQQGTQEESLCRRSDLGVQLEKKNYPIPTDSFFYLPKVTITEGKISCGIIAAELRSIGARTEQYLEKRIIDLYECCLKNKHDAIVLGAWGCGAFKESEDDAATMAKIFKRISKKYETKVRTVFAVLYKRNFEVFKSIIEG